MFDVTEAKKYNSNAMDLINHFNESELVLGLVGAVGAQLDQTSQYLKNRLKDLGFHVHVIKVSKEVIPLFVDTSHLPEDRGYERTSGLMQAGNDARMKANDDSVLALGVATRIHRLRPVDSENNPMPKPRTAYVVSSLKRPEEVKRLRNIYGNGFYLIAAHNDYEKRLQRLTGFDSMSQEEAIDLIERDFDDDKKHGQRLNKTFSLADFFIRVEAEGQDAEANTISGVDRILRVICGDPFVTPTFDEHAMYFAFTSALRSADLSRQVGAVIAVDEQIVAHGANECPKYGGGLYWPIAKGNDVTEYPKGRDFTRPIQRGNETKIGYDSNKIERDRIIEKIISQVNEQDREAIKRILESSSLADITEYGRVVHAEMSALLSCAKFGIPCRDATIYSTTFPCHNCAKHIIAAGIVRVVYIEPYPKSKALDFHDESISLGFQKQAEKVHFEPFVGVGPRRFFDLFSYRHGSGRDVQRAENGFALEWENKPAVPKLQMSPLSYLNLEELARDMIAIHEITKPEKEISNESSS